MLFLTIAYLQTDIEMQTVGSSILHKAQVSRMAWHGIRLKKSPCTDAARRTWRSLGHVYAPCLAAGFLGENYLEATEVGSGEGDRENPSGFELRRSSFAAHRSFDQVGIQDG